MAQPAPAFEQPLPQNVDAELATLGAILLDNAALDVAMEKLSSGDFFSVEHQQIFHAMLELKENGTPIDLVSLTEHLHRTHRTRLLENVGGAGYVAKLGDGLPRSTNVAHYAQIVKEKAQLRSIIHVAAALQQRALEGHELPQEIFTDMEEFCHQSQNGNGHHKLHSVATMEVLTMSLEPVEYVIESVLPVKGLGMLYAPRGMGKTFVALEIAHCISTGEKKCFGWTIPQARRVLYVDGEMPANRLQERLRGIARGHGMRLPVDPQFFRVITRDLEDREARLDITTAEGQNNIEQHLRDGDVLILDNLSCLSFAGKENEGDDWVPILGWLLRLRWRGISVLFIHHAGKSGTQRGASRKEDALDCVIAMRAVPEYSADQGLKCEIHFEKLRNDGAGDSLYPFELTMQTFENGAIMWLKRPLSEVIEQAAKKMFEDGMSIRDVAEELHISKRRAHTIKLQMRKIE
jgi:hypothetical protein